MGSKQEKNVNVKQSSKDASVGISVTKLKHLVMKVKGFLGFFSCKGIQEALIKHRKYSLILKIKSKYIAIFTTNKSLEIFDSAGFFSSSKPCELRSFIKAQSINKKLVVNVIKIKSEDSLKLSILFLLLHQKHHSYNKTVKHILNICK